MSTKQIGGLILKTKELLTILNEPNTFAIGFGLPEMGIAKNVDLVVYKVFVEDEKLKKEVRQVKYKMGASAINMEAEPLELFEFDHIELITSSQFDFTYIEKEQFLELLEDEEEEIFLSGSIIDFKEKTKTSQWFTISITPREEISSDLEGLAASFKRILLPSPPFYKGSSHVLVTTFFATDRKKTGNVEPSNVFGGERSEITYGTCQVSIPSGHKIGQLESPSLWKFEWNENSDKHVVLREIDIKEKNNFYAQMSERIIESEKKMAFLFVHGYNVTFEVAARRTAQISYDLGFDGAPVFYSWPSQGKVLNYPKDEQNIQWSKNNLELFLEDFFTKSKAEKIFLIAHSMGNRSLTRALGDLLKEKPDLAEKLEEIILTAPDIDAEVFKRDIAPPLIASSRPITLYASSTDLPLIGSGSKLIHGFPRVGDSRKGIVIIDGIESIDATGVDTSFLGHSYFGSTRSVLSDIHYIVKDGIRAGKRFGLEEVLDLKGRYWKFKE